MYCNNCQLQNEDGTLFCLRCGARLQQQSQRAGDFPLQFMEEDSAPLVLESQIGVKEAPRAPKGPGLIFKSASRERKPELKAGAELNEYLERRETLEKKILLGGAAILAVLTLVIVIVLVV